MRDLASFVIIIIDCMLMILYLLAVTHPGIEYSIDGAKHVFRIE